MEKSIYSEEYLVFLQFLQEARKSAGMTQSDVASRLGTGVTQSFVSKCERGERRIDIVELRAFCRALGMPFDSFVLGLESILRERIDGAATLSGAGRDGHQDGHRDGKDSASDERINEILKHYKETRMPK